MSGFCRGCLIKYDEFIELLQYTEKNRRLFLYSTSIQVKQNDNIKFQLCKDCYVSMKLACKFKKQCKNSDKIIKNYLALKDAGDNQDLSTYLKNKDASHTFRLPMLMGNSTPANQKAKEDDNESTCTSIRNFITDIMHGEEIFETEANIIHEVMQEEPDVLDDSLDSQWLQDDASIESDFRLDFSISPFSTPHSTHNYPNHLGTKLTSHKYHCYAPNVTAKSIEKTLTHMKEEKIEITETFFTGNENMLYSVPEEIDMNINENLAVKENQRCIEEETSQLKTSSDRLLTTNLIEENIEIEHINNCETFGTNMENYEKSPCPIDRNLEKALKNVNNDVFALSDVLASSSPDFAGISPASTPRIRDILYGDNCDIAYQIDSHDTYKVLIENNKNDIDEVDILEDFFNDDNDPNSLENGVIEAYSKQYGVQRVGEEQISIKNLCCKMCQKHFQSVKGLKLHFAKYHKLEIIENLQSRNKRYFKKHCLCEFCGTEYTDVRSFFKHFKTHMKKEGCKYSCDHCELLFTSKSKLTVHMKTHGITEKLPGEEEKRGKPKKLFTCTYCSAEFKYVSNYTVHVRRHTKDYTERCKVCKKGFYRKFDLDIHMRQHTNERPFKCMHCPISFKRRDCLIIHTKKHFDEKKFTCAHCGIKFTVKYHLTQHLKRNTCVNKRTKAMKKRIDTLDTSQPRDNELETTEESLNAVTEVESDKTEAAEIKDHDWEILIVESQKKGAGADNSEKSKEVMKKKTKNAPAKKSPKTNLKFIKSNKRNQKVVEM